MQIYFSDKYLYVGNAKHTQQSASIWWSADELTVRIIAACGHKICTVLFSDVTDADGNTYADKDTFEEAIDDFFVDASSISISGGNSDNFSTSNIVTTYYNIADGSNHVAGQEVFFEEDNTVGTNETTETTGNGVVTFLKSGWYLIDWAEWSSNFAGNLTLTMTANGAETIASLVLDLNTLTEAGKFLYYFESGDYLTVTGDKSGWRIYSGATYGYLIITPIIQSDTILNTRVITGTSPEVGSSNSYQTGLTQDQIIGYLGSIVSDDGVKIHPSYAISTSAYHFRMAINADGTVGIVIPDTASNVGECPFKCLITYVE